ncbi:efflux RND transporter permease subunit [Shigella flexneri]
MAVTAELKTADDYRPLIVHYNRRRGSTPGRCRRRERLGTERSSSRDGDGKPAILLVIRREWPAANIIATVARIREQLPVLQDAIPASVDMQVAQNRTPTIRASLTEVGARPDHCGRAGDSVVFLFCARAAPPLSSRGRACSLIGTFSAMYLGGFSLNNLSLMALTVATGFVVDDAIVVLENIARQM